MTFQQISIFTVLVLATSTLDADVISSIKSKAKKDPKTFWTNNYIHTVPTKATFGPSSYAQVTIVPKNTVMGEESSPCIDCNHNYVAAVSEYIFNMYLRVATMDAASYMLECEADEDSLIDIDYLGVFDPLFINRNNLSMLINNGSVLSWYNSQKLYPLIQKRLFDLMKGIGVVYDAELAMDKKCSAMFIKMLDKSMSYYGMNKSLKLKNSDYSKVEPLYYYNPKPNILSASEETLKVFNTAMSTALASTNKGANREFVYYYQGETSEWEDLPGGGMKATKTQNYTYRPVADECRVLSYVIGSKTLDLVPGLTAIYEIWALPHTTKNSAKENDHLMVVSSATLANGKIPSKKWTYHVAIVAMLNNEPVVLDGLFYKEAVSLLRWQKLFNPSTRFMLKPFVRSSLIDASFIKPKTGDGVILRPHPVYQ